LNSSEYSITITTDDPDREKLMRLRNDLIEHEYDLPLIKEGIHIVSIVTQDRRLTKNLYKAYELAYDLGECYLDHLSSNRMTLSLAVDSGISTRLIKRLHYEFVEKRDDIPETK